MEKEVDTQQGDVIVLGFAGFITAAILTGGNYNIEFLGQIFITILGVSLIKNIMEKL